MVLNQLNDLLKKSWPFLLVAGIITYGIFQNYKNNELLESLRQNYSKLSEEKDKLYQEQQKKRDELENEMTNKIVKLEKTLAESKIRLEQERRNKIKVIANEINEPEKLSGRIKDVYGFIEK